MQFISFCNFQIKAAHYCWNVIVETQMKSALTYRSQSMIQSTNKWNVILLYALNEFRTLIVRLIFSCLIGFNSSTLLSLYYVYHPGETITREQENRVTSYIDASNVYGSNPLFFNNLRRGKLGIVTKQFNKKAAHKVSRYSMFSIIWILIHLITLKLRKNVK